MAARPSPSVNPAGTYRIARVLGVPVVVKPSLLIMGALLVYIFAPRLATPGGTNPYVLGVALVVALYASVLVHELAHMWIARIYRMHVSSITLHFMGGETAIEGESRTPAQEILTSIAGPFASFAVAGAAATLASIVTAEVQVVSLNLAYINLLVGIVNLLPALPLDGGRALRGAVWKILGDRDRATVTVAWIGRVMALAVAVAPFAIGFYAGQLSVVNIVLAALIAVFLWTGSTDALHNARLRGALGHLRARDLAVQAQGQTDETMPMLRADLTGAALLHAMSQDAATSYRLVEPDGSIFGILRRSDVDTAYRKGMS